MAPGLEPALVEELHDHGLSGTVEPGGVSLAGSPELLVALHRRLATASRILVTVGRFRASALGELERKASALPWGLFLARAHRPAFRVTTRKSRLYHTGAIAERLERAAATVVGGAEPDAAAPLPPTPFVVRIVRDRVVVRADASGEHLHRRGYRQIPTRAPLRETLAAGVLRLVGWAPTTPLVDPMCGSGTFPIEAALRAGGDCPGKSRSFAFERWPAAPSGSDSRGPCGSPREPAPAARTADDVRRPPPPAILGFDRDAGAIAAARANAEAAELTVTPHFARAAISEVRPPAGSDPGLLICNPPWGLRVGDPGPLRDLHARLGQVARRHFGGWTLGLVSPSATLVAHVDPRARRIATTASGGVTVGVWKVDAV